MSELLAIVDGRVVDESSAAVPIDNPSFLSGYGVFDTMYLWMGRPVFWKNHVERLRAGAARLGIAWPKGIESSLEAIGELARRNLSADEGALRITLTPAKLTADGPVGSFWLATVRPIPERTLRKRRGINGATLGGGVGRAMPDVKSTSYVAPYLPLPAGSNEWILVDRNGKILEGGSSNLFLEVKGELVTPPVSAGLLPGIVRSWVLEIAPALGIAVRSRRFAADDFFAADGAFATASLTGIAGWLSLDGRRGPGLGPVGRRLVREYRLAIRESVHAVL